MDIDSKEGAVDHVELEKAPRDSDDNSGTFHTPAEEASIIRKLDIRLLPLILILYSLSVLDRSNIGNAKIAGMATDINLSGNRYNWLATIFYISYILSQWTQIGWKHFKPHVWVTVVVIFWGFIATIQATTTTWAGLMICRFFLGIAESMYGPGVPLYMSFFYPKNKIGFRTGCFLSGSALANAYGGALAYGITQIHGTVHPWRILFIIEGVPTVLLASLAWFFFPDSINEAKFLTEREKEIAKAYVKKGQTADSEKPHGLRGKELLASLTDYRSYITGVMYFSCNVSFASLPLFLPTIISEMGSFTTLTANGLTAPPYLLVFFMIILTCFVSDRIQMRGPLCCVAALIAAMGFILLATTEATATRYLGVFFAVNIFVCVSLVLTWVANIHATESKRAGGYAILATIGQCGPLVGTNIFPASEAPYYRRGMWISCAFCLLVAFLSVVLSVLLARENREIDRRAEADRQAGGEQKEVFRYVI